MGKGFSGSTIKSWFQYRCERKVRFELSSNDELREASVEKDVRQTSWAALGNAFEDRVIARLASEEGVRRPRRPKEPLEEYVTIAFLRGDLAVPYIAQANLTPRGIPAFLVGTGLTLNRNLPDLIRRTPGVDGEPDLLTIIDVKATRNATAFHKTQVAFYGLVLEALLAELGGANPRRVRLDPFGEVWRIPDDGTADGDAKQVERFALLPYRRLVDEFCGEILPRIAARPLGPHPNEPFFHIYFKCEQCEYLGHCARSISPDLTPDKRDVSAVAGLTHEGKRALLRMKMPSVSTLAAAAGLAGAPGIGWSLSRKAAVLAERAQALMTSQTQRTAEEHTFLMPRRADVMFLLSVDHDPVDDRLAAIGYRRLENGAVAAERIVVPADGTLTAEAEAMIDVLGRLIRDLTDVDTHNANELPGSANARFAHIFFYEPTEAVNLQRAVGRHLDNEVIRTALLNLVRLFPPEDIVPEPEFRGVHHLPATAIRSVLEQLYALPVMVSFDLRQASGALALAAGGPAYMPAPAFERPFSSLLSIDVIRPFRERHPSAPTMLDIVADVAARLDALAGIIAWLFAENLKAEAVGRPLLRLAKKPFAFQATFDPLNAADLDMLLACELLENRAGMLEALVGLAQPSTRRRDAGRCLSGLTYEKSWRLGPRNRVLLFKVPPESRESELGPGDFDLIVTNDSPDLRLNFGLWPLVRCQIRPSGAGYEDRHDIVQIQVSEQVFQGPIFQDLIRDTPAGGFCIDRAFWDVNTPKAAAFLANLASAA
jgi:hypothetical protein